MPRLIKELIEHFLTHNTSDWQLRLMRQWPDMVGNLHTKMSLEKIEGSVLKIGVYDSHWIPELFMLTPTMVRAINHKLGGTYIASMRFSLKEKKQKSAQRPVTPSIVYRKVVLTTQQQQMLTTIKDDDLRSALKEYLIRCLQ
jgi:hypothetical protein